MFSKRLIWTSSVIIAAAFIYWINSGETPIPVTVITAERGDVTASISNTRAGTVKACRRAGIAPNIGGQIAKKHVEEGDSVETNQVLIQLWNEDRAAERRLAERGAEAARTRAREQCVTADVTKREAERLRQLLDRNLASEESAERAIGQAQAQAAACEAGRITARVSEMRVDVAEAALERTILRAPFDGVVAEINGELGEFVTPSPVGIPTPPTVDLIDQDCLYISAPIDEVDAPHVKAGLPALISIDAFSDRNFSGIVQRVAPYVSAQERQARTVTIEAVINDPDKDALIPGYSADVEVILDSHEGVIRIPTSVVLDGTRVYVFDEVSGVISERTVQRGLWNWEYTEIIKGVTEGELVVTSVDRDGVNDGVMAVLEN